MILTDMQTSWCLAVKNPQTPPGLLEISRQKADEWLRLKETVRI